MRAAISRRALLANGGALLASLPGLAAPPYSRASQRPQLTHGVQSGDVAADSGMVWTRADRPARIFLEYATTESFRNAVQLPPVDCLDVRDFTSKRLLTGLPADQTVFFRMRAADLSQINMLSEPVIGRFRTAPASRRNIRFAWSADTAGQGWGIDDTGMLTYSTMAGHDPDFLIHCGDGIYADGPMTEEVRLRDGTVWRNTIVTDEKRKVAETLAEFRGQWKYNLLDRHLLDFNASCPTFFMWDDHDVVDNWSDSKNLADDARYSEKSIHVLSARALRAFHEMTPVRPSPEEPGRIYRKISWGPLLDVFFLDLRRYRGPNGESMETEISPRSRILGREQIAWLKRELGNSRALWKVIASDMPLGLIVWDNYMTRQGVEAVANGDHGVPKGREMEIADLLRFIKHGAIDNIVWLTGDVHYTAAHFYDPHRAAFSDFEPFWEFVSGPIHAGTFGPNELDGTFGPQVRFIKAPAPEQGVNLPPSTGLQFFGLVEIDGLTGQLTVRLMDRDDNELYSGTLDPAEPG